MTSVTQLKLINGLATARLGRECDPKVILQQIGAMTVLGVCGGKWASVHNYGYTCGVLLMVGASRAVEVILDYDDTYSVRRTRLVTSGARKDELVVEYKMSGIYCDQLTEVVWSASNWK